MKNSIIKVSIILIFMLFSACLFNFCFAWEIGTDVIVTDTISYNLSSSTTGKAEIRFANFTFFQEPEILPTVDNVIAPSGWDESLIESVVNAYYNKVLFKYISNDRPNSIYFGYPSYDSYVLKRVTNTSTALEFTTLDNEQPLVNGMGRYLRYDYVEKQWYVDNGAKVYGYYVSKSTGTSFNSTLYYSNDMPYTLYDYDFSIIYEPIKEPANEELITNCDFKVNFKFAPDNDDYPTKVDKHWYVYETCLVTHTMSNWSNYKVDMSISANKENSRGGANTYFELYNNIGDKLIDKHNLENNIPIGGDLSDGDFYLLLTDNITDVMTITYNIYNNYNNELLIKKVYKVKFNQGGFGAVDFTGTIIEDKTYDANGEIISGSNTGFETNGNDATTGTGSSDYYDVTDLELITNNATNTINLAKQCFSILPGFIWVMVGIFLSVCLALRILGR